MTAAIISEGFSQLCGDAQYTDKHSIALHEELQEYTSSMPINRALVGCKPGPDTIWAWVAMSENIPLHVILACQDYGIDSAISSDKFIAKEIRDKAKSMLVLGSAGWTPEKEKAKNIRMIDQANLIFAIKNDVGAFTEDAIRYAKNIGREIIYIDVKELI